MASSLRHRTRVQRAFVSTTDDLGRRVVNGAIFTFFGIALRTGITVGSMAVLARLLTPTDFGHLAMATVVTELAAIFSNFGFGSILIQRLRITRIQIDTMFWSAIGLGVMLTTVVFFLSFYVGHFFNDETVGPLLRVLCLSFVLEELTLVPRSLLTRRMLFNVDFYIQTAMLFARAGTAIVLALNDFGVWSLVGGALCGLIVQSCGYQIAGGYWPRARFSASFLNSTWRTNGGYFGNGVLYYVNSNLDFLLVGRMLGASLLGQYQNARSLTDEIRSRMAQPLQRVLFPAFSAIQNDLDRFKGGVLRSGRLLALIFIPMGFGIAAVASELVSVLYGDQWLAMIPVLQVLSVATGFTAVMSIGSPVLTATNRLGLSFRLYLAQTAFAVVFMLIGSNWGLIGVAWSRLVLVVVGLVFFRVSLGLIGMRGIHIYQIMGAPLIASVVMWFVLGSVRGYVSALDVADAIRLVTLVGIGMTCYVITSLLISGQHVQVAKEVLFKVRRRRGGE